MRSLKHILLAACLILSCSCASTKSTVKAVSTGSTYFHIAGALIKALVLRPTETNTYNYYCHGCENGCGK